MLFKAFSIVIFCIGITGTVFGWFALKAVDSSGNITDKTNMFLPLFQQIGCEIGCIRIVQPICFVLLLIGCFLLWISWRNGKGKN